MDHIGFEWHSIQVRNQVRRTVDELGLRAFQIDPGWYETHWLIQAESKPLGGIRRFAAAASVAYLAIAHSVSDLRGALSELPSDTGYQRPDIEVDEFPTWFGHPSPRP
jgi:hypothetical protein